MPKFTVIPGELRRHNVILSKIKTALRNKDFNLIFIFPTLSLLKEIREKLLNEPDLGGVGGVRLLLFEGFIEELIRRFNIEGRRPSLLEQELLVRETFFKLNQAERLNYLNRAPFTASYRRAMLEGIREWKRAGLTPEIFKDWAAGQSAKEKELALVYEEYQRLLIERGLNEEDRVLSCLEELRSEAGEMPETIPAVIYGFTDLTPLQNDYLKTLEFWFDFEFLIDPTNAPEFQKIVSRQFSVKIPKIETDSATQNSLKELQNNYGTKKPAVISFNPEDHSLQMIQAAGPIREATGIAREIVKLMLDNRYNRLDDFLIITPNPREFQKIAGPIFKQYGLNIGGSENRTALEYPAINQFYEALTACDNDWQWPEMELLIRYYYAGVDPTLGDRFLLWIGQHYGGVSSRRRWLDLAREQQFIQSAVKAGFDLEPLNRMIEWLNKIPAQALLKDYLDLTQEWFETQRFCDSGRFSEDSDILALEVDNLQAVQACFGVLEEIGRVIIGLKCFEAELNIREFQQFLNHCWSELPIGSPGFKSSSIRVIPPREARGLNIPVVFVTGMEQGTFPRVYVNDWKLAPLARKELRAIGIELETGEQYQIQEALAFYWSLQTAGDRLYLVYRDQDGGGQPQNCSIFLDEVLQWVPELEKRAIRYGLAPRAPSSFSDCHGDIERNEWLINTLLHTEEQIEPEQVDRLWGIITDPKRRKLVLRLSDRRLIGVEINLGQNIAIYQLINSRFGVDHRYSITAIEDYRSCPYRFFLKHLLKVKPAPRPTLLPELLDLGLLYHAILREFGKKFCGQSLCQGEIEHYWDIIVRLLEDQYREWRRWAGSELAEMVLSLKQEEIRKTLRLWLESEVDWTKTTAGRFKLHKLEWGFGIDDANFDAQAIAAPYRLDDGQAVINIWGRVDRVDIDVSGNFTVYDYKLGKGPSTKDLVELNNLQIPVYLLALEQLCFGSGQAVGGSYLGLRGPSRDNGGIWNRERLGPVLKGKGVLGQTQWDDLLEAVKEELITAVTGIRSGKFNLTGDDCPKYCEYQSSCRRLEREVTEQWHTRSINNRQ